MSDGHLALSAGLTLLVVAVFLYVGTGVWSILRTNRDFDRSFEETSREKRIYELEQWLDNWDAAAWYDEASNRPFTRAAAPPPEVGADG